jgi:hypothetical protein
MWMTVSSIFHVRSNPVFYKRYKNHPKKLLDET